MTKLTTALLATLLATGCGATSAHNAIMSADARWYEASGVEEPWPSRVEERTGAFACGGLRSGAVGCYNSRTDTITLDVNQSDHMIRQAAVHEWGHKLGAGHAGPGQGIMSPRLSEAKACITQADLDRVCGLRTCKWERPECR